MKFTFSASALAILAMPLLARAAPTENEKRQTKLPTTLIYDDQNPAAVYSESWTHLKNQGFKLQDKTISYTSQANAEVHFPNPMKDFDQYPFDVTVYSTKKADRGPFNVYCGHKLIGTGTGNEKVSSGETNTQVVFHVDSVMCPGNGDFVVKNDKGAKFLAIDSLVLKYNAPPQ